MTSFKLDGTEFSALSDILREAFVDRKDLQIALGEMTPPRQLADLATAGKYPWEVQQLLVSATQEGWLPDIVGMLEDQRPERTDLIERTKKIITNARTVDILLVCADDDRPNAQTLSRLIEQRGFSVALPPFSEVEISLIRTSVVALCFGVNFTAPFNGEALDKIWIRSSQEFKNLISVVLPGAKDVAIPSKFLTSKPIIFDKDMAEEVPLGLLYKALARGKEPEPQPATITTIDTDAMDAVQAISEAWRTEGINLFLGPFSGLTAPGDVPTPYDVARALAIEYKYITESHVGPPPSIETIASWLSLQRSSIFVEDRLREIYQEKRHCFVQFYEDLAKLLRAMTSKSSGARSAKRPPPLIFTTSHANYIEQELFKAGVSFTCIVVDISFGIDVRRLRVLEENGVCEVRSLFPSGKTGGFQEQFVAKFKPGDDQGVESALDALADMPSERYPTTLGPLDNPDETIVAAEFSIDQIEGCILFKYHGSMDVRNSCVISSDQLYRLTRAREIIPTAILTRITNSPCVLFGYSSLLSEVQQTYQSVLIDAFRLRPIDARYLVRKIHTPAWRASSDGWLIALEDASDKSARTAVGKMGLKTLEGDQRDFVQAIRRQLDG